jgi:hypothetical protein
VYVGNDLAILEREIEKVVTSHIGRLFDDPVELIASAWLDVPTDRIMLLHERCAENAVKLRGVDRETASALLVRVCVHDGHVQVDCDTAAIASLLHLTRHVDAPPVLTLTAEVRLRRSGMAMKLVQGDGSSITTTPDRSLVRQLITARRWWSELRRGARGAHRILRHAHRAAGVPRTRGGRGVARGQAAQRCRCCQALAPGAAARLLAGAAADDVDGCGVTE